jgi:hypothetical protein
MVRMYGPPDVGLEMLSQMSKVSPETCCRAMHICMNEISPELVPEDVCVAHKRKWMEWLQEVSENMQSNVSINNLETWKIGLWRYF